MSDSKGFTLIEALFSFSIILILSLTLFPMFFQMINKLQDEKKEMVAYRLIYEALVPLENLNDPVKVVRKNRGIVYEVIISQEKACVHYEEQIKCIE